MTTPPRRRRPRVSATRSSRGLLASAPQGCALDCGRMIQPGDPIARTKRGNAHAACVMRERGE
jgi:hypothetical protein